jgi:hypothetical protein
VPPGSGASRAEGMKRPLWSVPERGDLADPGWTASAVDICGRERGGTLATLVPLLDHRSDEIADGDVPLGRVGREHRFVSRFDADVDALALRHDCPTNVTRTVPPCNRTQAAYRLSHNFRVLIFWIADATLSRDQKLWDNSRGRSGLCAEVARALRARLREATGGVWVQAVPGFRGASRFARGAEGAAPCSIGPQTIGIARVSPACRAGSASLPGLWSCQMRTIPRPDPVRGRAAPGPRAPISVQAPRGFTLRHRFVRDRQPNPALTDARSPVPSRGSRRSRRRFPNLPVGLREV